MESTPLEYQLETEEVTSGNWILNGFLTSVEEETGLVVQSSLVTSFLVLTEEQRQISSLWNQDPNDHPPLRDELQRILLSS
jgi:hypothetical protein